MNIADTMANARRRRRTYSPDFKREVVAQCHQPGASVSGVGLFHGINANIVHRWLREAARSLPPPAFVPVTLDPPPATVSTAPRQADIRIEVEHGARRVVVNWPLAAADECAAWLRAWLA